MTAEPTDLFRNLVGCVQQASREVAETLHKTTTKTGETVGTALYEWVEQGTETVGSVVTPIATHPVTQFAVKVPGLSWLMAALGQVDTEAVERDVAALRQAHPSDSGEQLAQRAIAEMTWRAAAIGLTTNFVPPLALMLLAVDLGAIAALQAEAIYRIAACYGFSPSDPARRGEVMAIWGLSTGSSGVMKSGLSVVELIPLIGAAAGTVGNATMLYGLGQVACWFYEAKQRATVDVAIDPVGTPSVRITEPTSEPT